MSAESGLKTFRDNNGLWENHPVEQVATPEAFAANPILVHRFYNQRRAQLVQETKPNRAHEALAEFEQAFTGDFTLITQNVDDLHERGGSQSVVHMHGELRKARCQTHNRVLPWDEDLSTELICPCCQTPGCLRPHIVWFGEMPLFMDAIETKLAKCDLFIAIGTSGQVYPAAGFQQMAKYSGAKTVELNLAASATAKLFDQQQLGPASELVPRYFSELLQQ